MQYNAHINIEEKLTKTGKWLDASDPNRNAVMHEMTAEKYEAAAKQLNGKKRVSEWPPSLFYLTCLCIRVASSAG